MFLLVGGLSERFDTMVVKLELSFDPKSEKLAGSRLIESFAVVSPSLFIRLALPKSTSAPELSLSKFKYFEFTLSSKARWTLSFEGLLPTSPFPPIAVKALVERPSV